MIKRLPWGRLIGGVCTSLALVGVLYLGGVLRWVSFIPFDLADILIALTPGDVATQGIEALGELAKVLLKLASVALFVALGAGLVLVAGRLFGRLPLVAGLAAGAALLAVMAALQAQAPTGGGAGAYAVLGGLALAWGLANGLILRRLNALSAAASDAAAATAAGELARDRRMFLIRSGSVLVTLAAGSRALAELVEQPAVKGAGARLPTSAPPRPTLPRPTATAGATATAVPGATAAPTATAAPPTATPPPPFVPPAGVRPEITEQRWLYRIAVPTRDPEIDVSGWKLEIRGAVDTPYSLTYDELIAMERLDQTSTLTCISNDVGDYLVGTCNWNGVPLKALLERAGVQAGAVDVVFYGVDEFSDSLPLAIAVDPHTLIAYGADGEALMVSHGFPARLIIPGKYGEKNVKWLTAIEVVREDYLGYWQQRGWTEDATVYTTSVIDTGNPRTMKDPLTRENGIVALGGIGFAGNRGISQIEIQIDGGPWTPVVLKDPISNLTWRLWRYDWQDPAPGVHTLAVRATDGVGELQTDAVQPTHPLGATGLHIIEVTVV